VLTRRVFPILACALAFVLSTAPAFAQNDASHGTLKIHVTPPQAYVFVDGKAIRDGSQKIQLDAGKHTVGVYNYGYLPQVQDVNITSGQRTNLDVTLQASGDKVSGPFGDIEIKGHPRAAVLLNGTTPAYFVGHVDEFDWNWIWHQRLLVKPGTYQLTATREGHTIWSGPVTVKAGQQVTVYLDRDGQTKTKDWKEGDTLGPQPRFHAGVASAEVPIAPVTAKLSADQTSTTCGQPAKLTWASTDAVDTSITNLGAVPASGSQNVDPTKNTSYELVAKGPGGEANQTVNVNVNAQPTGTLALSQPEVRYHKIGDKVVEQGSSTLSWSTSNANTVTLQPLGTLATSGSQTIEANPTQKSYGPVNQEVTYTLTEANACGGSATKTATLHIVGSIDPPPPVTLASLFYPTAYPQPRHPKAGLVAPEKQVLAKLAADFKNDEQYNHAAKLMIVAHADVRGSGQYNMALTERRASLVKGYLVSRGVSADLIQTRAEGKEHQLEQKDVDQLQAKDPQKPEKWMTHHEKTTWLAYNRRVDVILQPAGQQSTEAYPNDSKDARILWERPIPSLKTVENAGSLGGAAQNNAVASNLR
jgi:OmpA family/PEGA domain